MGELLLPRSDAGVLAQAIVTGTVLVAVLPAARRLRLLPLWAGILLVIAAGFALRALH